MSMATYLITGVAGFIGSSIARAVLAQGDKVRGIDNLSTGKRENLDEIADRVDFREADILDLEAVQRASEGVDYVFHEAAIPSVPKSVLDPLGSNRANVDATVNVLVATRRHLQLMEIRRHCPSAKTWLQTRSLLTL
jgi:nucleoside-diphosphate-sugar epimerase